MKVYKKPSEFSAATIAALKTAISSIIGKQGTVTGNIGGNARGANATDMQLVRVENDQVAAAPYSVISGGAYNKIDPSCDGATISGGSANKILAFVERGLKGILGSAKGSANIVYGNYSTAEGTSCINDAQIGHVEGNTCLNSTNDGHTEGNLSVGGRVMWAVTSHGIDTDADVGTKPFIVVNDDDEDITSFFPNLLTNATPANVVARYGAGATADAKGNVYPSGMTPAVWTGDVPTTENDLKWALHIYFVIKATAETNMGFYKCLKATYTAGSGVKIYYEGAAEAFGGAIAKVYSSTAPTVIINGKYKCGNSQHTEGLTNCTFGTAANASGYGTRARNNCAKSSGYFTEALGAQSESSGISSKALRENQKAFAAGKRLKRGDIQACQIAYNHSCNGAGWWMIYILKDLEDGKAYFFETRIFGRQISGSDGTVGDSFGYIARGCVRMDAGTISAVGTPTCVETFRTSGLSATVKCTWDASSSIGAANTNDHALIRFDSIANRLYYVQSTTNWTEITA